jgi:GGDEF domain-containing protein
MHYRVLVLAAWLLFLYNVERAGRLMGMERVDFMTAYAHVFIAAVALVTLAIPSLYRLPAPVLVSSGIVLFLFFKPWFGFRLWGTALPVTVTEICAVLVTGFLTRWVIAAVREFESSIVNFTIKHIGRQPRTFDLEQGEMYQEVRRARAFHRPLALLAIEPDASWNGAVEKMVAEVQRATMKQYVLAALVRRLEDLFGPYSIIAQDGDRFLVLLPERSQEEMPRLVNQLRGQVEESLHLDLRVGVATVPEIEMFEELVDAACADMQNSSVDLSEETVRPSVTSIRERLPSR